MMNLDFQGPTEIAFRRFQKDWLTRPVFHIFEDIVRMYPDKVAIRDGARQLTYQEVYHWALTVAQAIKPNIIQGEPIGIALKNDAFFPIAMLAALAIGCPYVPLDISFPAARNQLISSISGLKALITTSDIPPISGELNTVYIDKLSYSEGDRRDLTEAAKDSIAYIIYTSGSTGIPKGVYQNQQNLLHDVMQYTNSIHLSSDDRLSLLYSPSVGGGIRDIYGALLNGATLCILNLKEAGLNHLPLFLKREKITIYHSIPNIFRTFLKLNRADFDFSAVRLIYLAGDRIFNTDAELFKEFFQKKCLLYVGIGATEVATIYRQWFINSETEISQERIPLGYAVEDRTMTLVNEKNEVVPKGEIGEIVITSPYISLGYWNNPEQTAKSFSEENGLRTFRTGDLGKINDDGLLEFVGRKDSQVKINGYRIEISEIEGLLMNHPLVIRCAVLVHYRNASPSLVAFYMSTQDESEESLKKWMSDQLPAYMIPQRCIRMEEIPLLPNFKNDYAQLKEWLESHDLREKSGIDEQERMDKEPELMTLLRRTWTEFLDDQSFRQNTAWSDAGGTSLNAVNFLVQLEAGLNTTLPSEWIRGKMKPQEIYAYLSKLSLTYNTSRQKILYYFPPVTGMTENSRRFIQNLSQHVIVRIVNYPDFANLTFEESNWDAIRMFIERQIPDYNHPDVGFISNCNGGIVMGTVLGHKPLHSYWFVGIIDGHLSYKKPALHLNFKERLMDFLTRGNLLSRANTLLYNTFSLYQRSTDHFRGKQLIKNDPALTMTYLLTHNKSAFDGEVWYFKCERSPFDSSTETWKDHCKKVNTVMVKGNHEEMFEPENARLIQEKILSAR